MAETEITVINNTEKKRFEVEIDGHLALMEYKVNDRGRIYIIHTEVPEELGGRGIAKKLAEKALDFSRESNYEIFPACPFMSAYMKKRPELHSLVPNFFRKKYWEA